MTDTDNSPPIPRPTPKQASFIKALAANNMNATLAYIDAISKTASRKSAGVSASRLMKEPAVAYAVAQMRQNGHTARVEAVNRYAIDQGAIAAALARLSFSDVSDVCDLVTEYHPDPTNPKRTLSKQVLKVRDFADIDPSARFAIAKISQSADGRVTVEMADKRQALVNLATLLGLITQQGTTPIDPATGKPVDRFQPVVLQVVRKAG